MPLEPYDLKEIQGNASSIYEAIAIMARRARQINDELKQQFSAAIADVTTVDDEENESINYDQMKISLEFEKNEKPSRQAIDEMKAKVLESRYRDNA